MNIVSAPKEYKLSKFSTYYIFTLLFLLYFFDYVDRMIVTLLDLLVSKRAWCGHLCPVGAFYSLLAAVSLLRVSAANRAKCDDCMDCFAVCPEQQVIKPALKGAEKGLGPVNLSGNCTNCGRCIDVCARDVFQFDIRSHNTSTPGVIKKREVLP